MKLRKSAADKPQAELFRTELAQLINPDRLFVVVNYARSDEVFRRPPPMTSAGLATPVSLVARPALLEAPLPVQQRSCHREMGQESSLSSDLAEHGRQKMEADEAEALLAKTIAAALQSKLLPAKEPATGVVVNIAAREACVVTPVVS